MGLWNKLRGLVAGGAAAPAAAPAATPAAATARQLFAAEVIAALRALPAVGDINANEKDFSLQVAPRGGGADKEMTIFLGNIFAETRDMSPDARAERIHRFAGGMTEFGADDPDWDEVQERLVPILRTSTSYARVSDDPEKNPVRRPFAPFLSECIAIDNDTSFRIVTPFVIEKWAVDLDAVFVAARANAARCFADADVELYDSDAPYPLWHVAKEDTYESSRLVLPGWLASFKGRVAGRPVAVVPERATLIVGGDGDERCLRRLIDTARGEHEASRRSISPALYTVDDVGAVIPFVLPEGHPLANDVALGHIVLASNEYGAEQEKLQADLGDDTFVASYVGLKAKVGRPWSYTVWGENVASLLPRADYIVFAEKDRGGETQTWKVPWNVAVETVGDCLAPMTDRDPPRWRTIRWPAPAVLARLRALNAG